MEKDVKQESRAIWNENAAFWDEYMGEGGSFQRNLIGPTTERLLQIHTGMRVLDIACGNGAFSRRMAQLGARVVACDFAEEFIQRAKERTIQNQDRIDYKVVDATNEAELLALGKQRFDAAVCTMAMMDMPEIAPLLSAVRQLLRPHGRFVFSVTHPCFNSGVGMKKVVEQEDQDGNLVMTYAIKTMNYATPKTYKGLGIVGQPKAQYYFHRPLNLLFNTCFAAGFVMDALEEPVFELPERSDRPFSWENYREIPPVLIARLRLP